MDFTDMLADNDDGGFTKKNESIATTKSTLAGNKSCMPMNIAQMKKTIQQDNRFLLDKKEITNISNVAIVRTISKKQQHAYFSLEDGTGVIDAKYWYSIFTDADDEQKYGLDVNVITCDTYVHTIGRLHKSNDRLQFIIYHIAPVQDLNEINYHLLDTMHTHLLMKTNSDKHKSVTNKKSSDNLHPATYEASNYDNSSATIVKRAIKACGMDMEGTHIQAVTFHLRDLYTELEVKDVITRLINEGQINYKGQDYIKLVEL